MIIERKMHCCAEDFFDVIVEAIIQDVKSSTDKTITEHDIHQGYSYSKLIANKKNHPAKATVKTYEKNKHYCLQVTSDSGKTTMDYSIIKIDKDTIKVTYREEFQKRNGKVSNGYFYKRAVNKRVNTYLNKIEDYIHSKNNGKRA